MLLKLVEFDAGTGKKVIFIDKIPWMDTAREDSTGDSLTPYIWSPSTFQSAGNYIRQKV